MPLALDVLSDILADPTFDAEELRREQNVIVQEIGAAEDAPDDLVFERLQETAFPDQPVGRSILGTPEPCARSIRRGCALIWRATIAVPTWWSRRPARSSTRRSSPKSRSVLPASRARRRRRREPAKFGGGTRVETRDLEQVHIALALEGVPAATMQLYSLQVFTSVLGGGMSSRLFQEVREKRGLCYTIYAFHMPYADTGLFGLYAGTDEAMRPN